MCIFLFFKSIMICTVFPSTRLSKISGFSWEARTFIWSDSFLVSPCSRFLNYKSFRSRYNSGNNIDSLRIYNFNTKFRRKLINIKYS